MIGMQILAFDPRRVHDFYIRVMTASHSNLFFTPCLTILSLLFIKRHLYFLLKRHLYFKKYLFKRYSGSAIRSASLFSFYKEADLCKPDISKYMTHRRLLYFAMPLLLAAGCAGKTSSSIDKAPIHPVEASDSTGYSLPIPMPPKEITTPEGRAAYIAAHYWDAMDWQDTLLLSSPHFMGESMANYGLFLSMSEDPDAISSIDAVVNASATNPKALATLSRYAYDYFYHPDSPQDDAELYLKFVNSFLTLPSLDDADRERLKERKSEILKNRIGSLATDFDYIGSDGQRHSLLSTAPESELRILFIYNPDCERCEKAAALMKSSPAFTAAQREGRVSVIAINAYGQEGMGPAQRKSTFPPEWTVGYSPDGKIDSEETYIIRSTPSIYLIDTIGSIIDKDLSMSKLEKLINNS